MADITIPEMTASPGASLTDLLESITSGGDTYKLTLQQILTLFSASLLPVTINTLTTTNASFNSISNIELPVNTVKKISASIVGKRSGGTQTAWGTLDITVSRAGGDITLISSPVFNSGASGAEDIEYDVDTGTQSLIINVKGINAQTYNWTCIYSTQTISD